MAHLSISERDVLLGMMNGEQLKDTAQRLRITPRTVKAHRGNIFKKLGLRNTQGNSVGALVSLLGHFEMRFIPNEKYLDLVGIESVPVLRAG